MMQGAVELHIQEKQIPGYLVISFCDEDGNVNRPVVYHLHAGFGSI